MPVCDTTTTTLEISLDATGTPELDVTAKYDVLRIVGGYRTYVDRKNVRVQTNGTTPVTVIPAPPAPDYRHELADFYLVQTNAATRTVSLKLNDNGTRYLMLQYEMAEGDNLRYA